MYLIIVYYYYINCYVMLYSVCDQEAEESGLDMPVDGGDRAASALMGAP